MGYGVSTTIASIYTQKWPIKETEKISWWNMLKAQVSYRCYWSRSVSNKEHSPCCSSKTGNTCFYRRVVILDVVLLNSRDICAFLKREIYHYSSALLNMACLEKLHYPFSENSVGKSYNFGVFSPALSATDWRSLVNNGIFRGPNNYDFLKGIENKCNLTARAITYHMEKTYLLEKVNQMLIYLVRDSVKAV